MCGGVSGLEHAVLGPQNEANGTLGNEFLGGASGAIGGGFDETCGCDWKAGASSKSNRCASHDVVLHTYRSFRPFNNFGQIQA
jgi:hypothetical protein